MESADERPPRRVIGVTCLDIHDFLDRRQANMESTDERRLRRVVGVPAPDIGDLAILLSTCDSVVKVGRNLRTCAGSVEGLGVERFNLGIEIDRLNEIKAAMRDSIQEQASSGQKGRSLIHDRLEEWGALEETMTETIVAAEQVISLLKQSSPADGLLGWRKLLQSRVDKVDTW